MAINYLLRWEELVRNHEAAFTVLISIGGEIYRGSRTSWELSDPALTTQLGPLIDDGLICIDNNSISFADESFAAFVVALYFIESSGLKLPQSDSKISDYIDIPNPRAPGFRSQTLTSYALIALNNIFNRDVLEIISSQCADGTHPRIYISFCEALPFLKFPIDRLEPVLASVQEVTKGDLTNGFLYTAVAELCRQQPPAIGNQLLSILLTNPTAKTAGFVPNVLDGLSKHDFVTIQSRCISLAEDLNLDVSRLGLLSLGILDYVQFPQLLGKAVAKLDEFLQSKRVGREYALARAYGRLLKFNLPIIDQVRDLILSEEAEAMYAIAEELWRLPAASQNQTWYKALVNQLIWVKPRHKGTLDRLDYVLHDIAKTDPVFVAAFFNRWLEKHEAELSDEESVLLKLFDTSANGIFQSNLDLTQHFLTRWLGSDCKAHHEAAEEVIKGFRANRSAVPELLLDELWLNSLSEEDVAFLINKICGFVHEPVHLCSLVFSVLRRIPRNQKLESTIEDVFSEYLGYNFPETTIEFLERKIAAEVPANRIVAENSLVRINAYYDALTALPRLKELEPSRRLQHGFMRALSKRRAKDMERVRSESVFLSATTTVPLKCGKSWFWRTEAGFSAPSRLQTISQSVEIWRELSLDSFGINFKITKWRNQTRDEINRS